MVYFIASLLPILSLIYTIEFVESFGKTSLLLHHRPKLLPIQHGHFNMNINKQYNNNDESSFLDEYFQNYLQRLNSRNRSVQEQAVLGKYGMPNRRWSYQERPKSMEEYQKMLQQQFPRIFNQTYVEELMFGENYPNLNPNPSNLHELYPNVSIGERRKMAKENPQWITIMSQPLQYGQGGTSEKSKTGNFNLVSQINTTFRDVGGYDLVKEELNQCVDILLNYKVYRPFNIRVPKGLILEGPPGNGKTLIAKAFAGEAKTNFISVSGSEFQEKYVGVGSTRVKELFELAVKNKPCVIFVDEIDAIGRKRSNDGETSGAERDNTLNQLLVEMDGFKNSDGVFVIGATNRADLLDPALRRPGRIDKNIFIGLPDAATRKAILQIHMRGKPHDSSIKLDDMVDLSTGLSAAQLENLLNEAMLHAIRKKRFIFTMDDIETVMNRVMAGYQPNEHQFTEDMIDRITVHEMGHAMIGLLMKQHSKLSKIVINLSSPKTPGYTVFEGSTTSMYTRDSLFEHLMILVAGRVAEEIFYNVSVTTGAINDFEEALKLAEKMVLYYGMGKNLIYPSNSEKFKTEIDDQVLILIQNAYHMSDYILRHCKPMMAQCAELLKKKKVLKRDELFDMIINKYPELLDLYIGQPVDENLV
jgi:cell division protease FtsH